VLVISFEYYEISTLQKNGDVVEAVVTSKRGPGKYNDSYGNYILTNQNRWNVEYCYIDYSHGLLFKGSFDVEKYKYDLMGIGSKITITYDRYSPSVSYVGDFKNISTYSMLSMARFPVAIFLILLLVAFHYIVYIFFIKIKD
jgi:hypothetical protein